MSKSYLGSPSSNVAMFRAVPCCFLQRVLTLPHTVLERQHKEGVTGEGHNFKLLSRSPTWGDCLHDYSFSRLTGIVCNYHIVQHYPSFCLSFRNTAFCCWCPETGTRSFYWVHLSRFHLKRTKSSLRNTGFYLTACLTCSPPNGNIETSP
jgi:hypothetical protein